MSELSPQAQAVLDAFLNGYIAAPKSGVAFCDDRNGLAAALRAVADQVLCRPEIPKNEYTLLMRLLDKEVRAIATELENQ